MTYFFLSLLFLIGFSLNLIGCVPLPSTKALEKRPFEGEQTSSIIVGHATKGEVERILGTPNATRRDDSVYIYEKPYIYGHLFYYLVFAFGMRPMAKDHLLIVQFNKNGVVKDIDHLVGKGTETQNGIYVADTGLRHTPYFIVSNYPTIQPPDIPIQQLLVLYSDRTSETTAKHFLVPCGKSAIYLYRENVPFYKGGREIVSVSLDGFELGGFGPEGFFYWIVDPGPHSITVTPIWPEAGRGWHHASINMECTVGQIYFVEQTMKSESKLKNFFLTEFFVQLSVLSDPAKGRHEVMKRRMILDCRTSIE